MKEWAHGVRAKNRYGLAALLILLLVLAASIAISTTAVHAASREGYSVVKSGYLTDQDESVVPDLTNVDEKYATVEWTMLRPNGARDLTTDVLILTALPGKGTVKGERYASSADSRVRWPWYNRSSTSYKELQVNAAADGTKVKVVGPADSMFRHAGYLEIYDFSGLDTSQATSMSYMFASCNTRGISGSIARGEPVEGGLDLDISTLSMDNCTSTSRMFSGSPNANEGLLTVTLPKNMAVKASGGTVDMSGMFNSSSNLSHVYNLETLHIDNPEGQQINMEKMFASVHNMKEINLSGLDCTGAKSISAPNLFEYTYCLQKVTLRKSFGDLTGSDRTAYPSNAPIWYNGSKYIKVEDMAKDLSAASGAATVTYTTDLSHGTAVLEAVPYTGKAARPTVKEVKLGDYVLSDYQYLPANSRGEVYGGQLVSNYVTAVSNNVDPTDNATANVVPAATNLRTSVKAQDGQITSSEEETTWHPYIYTGQISNVKFAINKSAATASDFEFTAPASTYDGKAKTASFTTALTNYGSMTVEYYKDGTKLSGAPKDVGDYTVKLSISGGSNVEAATGLSQENWKFTITPKTVKVLIDKQDKVYDGTADLKEPLHVYTEDAAKGESLKFTGVTGQYEQSNASTSTQDGRNRPSGVIDINLDCSKIKMEADNASTDIGNYEINYGLLPERLHGAVISKKPMDVYIYATTDTQNADKIYDGNAYVPKGVVTLSCETGIEGESFTPTLTEQTSYVHACYSQNGESVSKAGTWDVTIPQQSYVNFSSNDKAKLYNYEINFIPGKATINPKALEIDKLDAVDRQYDGTREVELKCYDLLGRVGYDEVTMESLGKGTVESADASDQPQRVSYAKPVLSGADSGNYCIADQEIDVLIRPKQIQASVTAQNKVYDGSVDAVVSSVTNTGIGNESFTVTNLKGEFSFPDVIDSGFVDIDHADAEVHPGQGTKLSNYDIRYPGIAVASITPKSIKDLSTLTVSEIAGQVYNGKAQKPEFTIYDSQTGETLKYDKDRELDYTVEYADNVNVNDDSRILIDGKGNYKDQLEVKFEIIPKDIADESIRFDDIAGETYTGSPIVPVPVVSDTSRLDSSEEPVILVEGTGDEKDTSSDYTVSYADNTEHGTARITVTGNNNYKGSKSTTFTIKPRSIAAEEITISDPSDYTYNGQARTPEITVTDPSRKDAEGNDLQLNAAEYQLEYKDNINAGTAVITIRGIGNYDGERTAVFNIQPKDINDETVVIGKILAQVYSGHELKPSLPAEDSEAGKSLVRTTDYTAAYSDNVMIGTASVTYTGVGNYTGSLKRTFKINKARIMLKGSLSSKMTLSWTKITGADGYELYVDKCGSGKNITAKSNLRKTLKGDVNTATLTRLGKKALNKKGTYRAMVRAYKKVDGKKVYLTSNSPVAHFVGSANTKFTNAKSVNAPTELTVSAGRTKSIRAKALKSKATRKWLSTGHAARVRYQVQNAAVASVDAKGKVTGIAPGTTKVFCIAQNGKYSSVKIIVK